MFDQFILTISEELVLRVEKILDCGKFVAEIWLLSMRILGKWGTDSKTCHCSVAQECWEKICFLHHECGCGKQNFVSVANTVIMKLDTHYTLNTHDFVVPNH